MRALVGADTSLKENLALPAWDGLAQQLHNAFDAIQVAEVLCVQEPRAASSNSVQHVGQGGQYGANNGRNSIQK